MKMSTGDKQIFFLIVANPILTISYFVGGKETFESLLLLFLFLYYLYGAVTIRILSEDSEGKDHQIAVLTRRNEYLEEELRKRLDK